MNYLAHAYLSFGDPDITVGQMIADFVKGKQLLTYPERIQQGIRLHRALDEYTDKHPATRRAKAIFQPSCGAYGGVFMDVVYDHYLANDASRFTPATLHDFSASVYTVLAAHQYLLPPFFQQVFTYMRNENWLYHYGERDAIYTSLSGIIRRAKYFEHPASVPFSVFEDHYLTLGDCYHEFFPDAEAFMKNQV